jgi:hypothetical protein
VTDDEVKRLFEHGLPQFEQSCGFQRKSRGSTMDKLALQSLDNAEGTRKQTTKKRRKSPQSGEAVRRLSEHRRELGNNKNAYIQDFPRLERTVRGHLRDMGYRKLKDGSDLGKSEVREYIFLIAQAQGFKPFFHVEGKDEQPYCWNGPEHWRFPYVIYQWGHLFPRSEGKEAHQLEKLSLQSARCNLHVQTALHIEDVVLWLEGSRVAQRIRNVQEARKVLFESLEWQNLKTALKPFQLTDEEQEKWEKRREARREKKEAKEAKEAEERTNCAKDASAA